MRWHSVNQRALDPNRRRVWLARPPRGTEELTARQSPPPDAGAGPRAAKCELRARPEQATARSTVDTCSGPTASPAVTSTAVALAAGRTARRRAVGRRRARRRYQDQRSDGLQCHQDGLNPRPRHGSLSAETLRACGKLGALAATRNGPQRSFRHAPASTTTELRRRRAAGPLFSRDGPLE